MHPFLPTDYSTALCCKAAHNPGLHCTNTSNCASAAKWRYDFTRCRHTVISFNQACMGNYSCDYCYINLPWYSYLMQLQRWDGRSSCGSSPMHSHRRETCRPQFEDWKNRTVTAAGGGFATFKLCFTDTTAKVKPCFMTLIFESAVSISGSAVLVGSTNSVVTPFTL